MKNILYIIIAFFSLLASGQVRIVNSTTNVIATNSSAFIDGSSNTTTNATTNIGKGVLYPRVDLTTFTSFGGTGVGLPNNYPGRYDGLVVYNTAVGGVAGVGATEGTLTKGFWYYDNPTAAGGSPNNTLTNAGTWKPVGAVSTVKTKTIDTFVLNSASAELNLNSVFPETVTEYLGAKIYNAAGDLVIEATSDFNRTSKLLTVGTGMLYQALPAATYKIVVEYK